MTNERDPRGSRFTRREALGILGAGASAAALSQSPLAAASKEPTFPRGAVIRTLLADLQPSALAGGATLFHEHMTQSDAANVKIAAHRPPNPNGRGPAPAQRDPITGCPGDVWQGCENLDFMVEELKRAKADGAVCIVDGAHPDLGRDIKWLTELSRRSGLSLVGSGGYYLDYFYPDNIASMSDDQLAEILIKDATDNPLGAFGEIGSSADITLNERKGFRAVGKAHLATGIPIFTHTDNGRCALEQLDILELVGVKLQHVVSGHMGSMVAPEVEVHKEICKRGAFVGFDRQGGNNDDRNILMVKKLLDAGYKDNLLFSADFGVNAWRNWKQNGGPGISRALTVWVPKVRAAGIDDDTIHDILVNNTRRWLAFVPKKPRGKANL